MEAPGSREAAVIVLHAEDTDSIILTLRSKQLRDHPGEICFPGGRWEMGDTTLSDTALRELHEELGIFSDRVRIHKMMRPELSRSGYLIYPWFASIKTLFPYTPNKEVDEVLELPMNAVCNLSNYKEIMVEKGELKIKTNQFVDDRYLVWGVTARIMMQLCEE